MKGYTIGLDLHQSFIQVVVFDEKGDDVEGKRIRFQREALEKLIGEWKARGEVQVVFEACSCFFWDARDAGNEVDCGGADLRRTGIAGTVP